MNHETYPMAAKKTGLDKEQYYALGRRAPQFLHYSQSEIEKIFGRAESELPPQIKREVANLTEVAEKDRELWNEAFFDFSQAPSKQRNALIASIFQYFLDEITS